MDLRFRVMASTWVRSGPFWTVATVEMSPMSRLMMQQHFRCFCLTACRVLADGIASLLCKIHKQSPNGKQEDIDAPLSHLLQFEPNPETSAQELLGRTTAGTLTLTQDSKGLAFSVTMPKLQLQRTPLRMFATGI
jgi:Caudovirus prohead serine protease